MLSKYKVYLFFVNLFIELYCVIAWMGLDQSGWMINLILT